MSEQLTPAEKMNFSVIETVKIGELEGGCAEFGLLVVNALGDRVAVWERVDTERAALEDFADLLNRMQPSRVHLADLVEDFVAEQRTCFLCV